jgi:formylglycine-generating enzyme required for sulfatase activity
VGNYAKEYPHPWGLTDVHGNVYEWCQDWYDKNFYSRSPNNDPECRDGEQMYKVLRGGCGGVRAWDCRAACRVWNKPAGRTLNYCGFRVVFCLD